MSLLKPGELSSKFWAVARQQNLTEYDAAYLELALRTGLPLATLDGNLNKAAKLVDVNLVKI